MTEITEAKKAQAGKKVWEAADFQKAETAESARETEAPLSEAKFDSKASDAGFEILYEDNHILVVLKPR